MKAQQSKSVTTTKTAIAGLPEHLQQFAGKNYGTETLGIEDLIIPRLEIVQALSPCKKKSDPQYIKDADDGMLYNNVTRKLYGDEVIVVPVMFRKEWLVWVDRQKSDGQGFRGAYPSPEAAKRKVDELDEDDLQIVDTMQVFCLLVNNGTTEDIVLSLSRSKAKIAKRWYSLTQMTDGGPILPAFCRQYRVSTVEEKGKKGTYCNFDIRAAGFTPAALAQMAFGKFEQITKGKVSVRADVSGSGSDEDDTRTDNF